MKKGKKEFLLILFFISTAIFAQDGVLSTLPPENIDLVPIQL